MKSGARANNGASDAFWDESVTVRSILMAEMFVMKILRSIDG